MDSIFFLNDGDRAAFLQHIMQSFGCTYICLWSNLPQPSNFLRFMDGFYHEENNQPSSSSGSLARRLFDEYRQSVFIVENSHVPGRAFVNNLPYIELSELYLQSLASTETQLQFYQEARIKTAIFMGCTAGEIELGMSNDTQLNLEMEMRNYFPEDFSRQITQPGELLLQPTDHQNLPSSSSSSLRSLSMESPEYPSLLFNIPSTPFIPMELPNQSPAEKALRPISTSSSPLHEAIQALSQIRRTRFPTTENEEDVMTKAMLAVISSSTSPSPSSSTASHHPQRNLPPNPTFQVITQNASAFKSYRSSGLAPTIQMTNTGVRRQNMLKRSITFLRRLSNLIRQSEQTTQGSRSTNTQLHHMISERRRREKLNESFQTLRSLLPPGTKKDKASVLASTTEYLNSLKTEVGKLRQRNQILEAQLPMKESSEEISVIPNERLDVRITSVSESTSETRIVDLQVTARGECSSMLDLVIRILEFLKQVKNVSLMSIEAITRMVESSSVNRLVLRLKIEGGEWDESAFQEAVRRVVDDLAQ